MQAFGLPMGSAPFALLGWLCSEIPEAGPFKEIIAPDTHNFRYIHDALLIYLQQSNFKNIVTKLNNMEYIPQTMIT